MQPVSTRCIYIILAIVGVAGEYKTPEEIDEILLARREEWKGKSVKYKNGVLRLFSQCVSSPMKGVYLDFDWG